MKKCTKCGKLKNKKNFYFRNKEKGYLQSLCKLCSSERYKRYRQNNLKKMAARAAEYRQKCNENINLWERNYRKKRYAQKKSVRVYALYRRNKRRVKEAAASVGDFNKEIRQIYKNCPAGHHVDHIIPINHPRVCGLHVPWNLQYLPAEENLKKSNKLGGL